MQCTDFHALTKKHNIPAHSRMGGIPADRVEFRWSGHHFRLVRSHSQPEDVALELVGAISARLCLHAIEYLPTHGKGAGIAAIDHGAGDHGSARSQVGKPIKIDIVEDARTVRPERLVVERPQLLVGAMFRTQPGRNGENLVAGCGRNKHFDAGKISGAAFAAILF